MSLSYAAHINGDKVYDIATGYWIEAKQEAAASAGRMQWSVYLYDDTGTFVEKYTGSSFPEADAAKYEFAGFDVTISSSTATWRVCELYTPSYSLVSATGTSSTLKQYFSGEQGYAINADYAVIDVQPLSVDANGTYTAPFSKAYSPVTVDVQEQPWQPLQDGYSNFWFELTNDTLSPWLRFGAKNNDAVIDWGDGSGEVALDTLTPTHTYAKAGKYIVKVKGVTGIARQLVDPFDFNGAYFTVLKYVELNSEITEFSGTSSYPGGFYYCAGLQQISGLENISTGVTFYNCSYCTSLHSAKVAMVTPAASMFSVAISLENVELTSDVTSISSRMFQLCLSLKTITIPSSVTEIKDYAFQQSKIQEIHMRSTVPPTLGTNVFANLTTNYIIYVPVGTGDTYKAAAGWNAYADHILEEGQTPNRAMLSRLAKAVETDTDEDKR